MLRNIVKPKATQQKSRVLTPDEKQWDYQPFPETCIGGVCGPTFESQSKAWYSDAGLIYNNTPDYSGAVLTPVAGLRG